MIELLLLKLFLIKDNYYKYRDKIKIKKEEKELSFLYKVLDDLMISYDRTISVDEYIVFALKEHPQLSHLTDQIRSVEVGEDMLSDLLKQAIERQFAYELALVAVEASEGRRSFSDAIQLISKYEEKEQSDNEDEFVTSNLEEIYQQTYKNPGLRWRLNTLNEALGSLRKGNFGFLFARPETGKTTFLASEISFMAEQLKPDDGPILWFNNEEEGRKVKARIIQGSLGVTKEGLYNNRQKSYNEYLEKTGDRILLKDSASITKRQIELLCKDYKPSLIIFDQIDKIKGFDNDREDLRLGSIYIWARELAKQYCPVIGICQADVSGENKKWLTMDNVANAKTSKQAEADWILGIGTVHDEGLKYVRYLHLSKNKLDGDEDTNPELRHGKMEVLIRPDIARYEDF